MGGSSVRIGFTGTSKGMSIQQHAAFARVINGMQPRLFEAFHHGDCVGADAQAHREVLAYAVLCREVPRPVTVIHPPEDTKARAYCRSPFAVWLAPRPYLRRNHDIVDCCDRLLAAPAQKDEQRRSGTWATVRYARKQHKPIFFIFPDGTIVFEDTAGMWHLCMT